jgi:hypothetical protein
MQVTNEPGKKVKKESLTSVGKMRRLELRWEALNAFNHPQFVNAPLRNVFITPAGRFLNRDFTDSGIRSMWVQMKLVF